MKAFARLLIWVGLALAVPATGNAATINLGFPSVSPDSRTIYDHCHSFLGLGGSHCTDRFVFTLLTPGTITINITSFNTFKSYDWSLSGTSLTDSGGRIHGMSTIADIESLSLGPGRYVFKLRLGKGKGNYRFLISLDDPVGDPLGQVPTGTPTELLLDPPTQTPIPGAALLFVSGLGALGVVSRFRRRSTVAPAGQID